MHSSVHECTCEFIRLQPVSRLWVAEPVITMQKPVAPNSVASQKVSTQEDLSTVGSIKFRMLSLQIDKGLKLNLYTKVSLFCGTEMLPAVPWGLFLQEASRLPRTKHSMHMQ